MPIASPDFIPIGLTTGQRHGAALSRTALPGRPIVDVETAHADLNGISLGSDFGLSARYQSNWSGRFYAPQEETITLGAFPVAAYRINPWLSVGAGAQIVYGKLNSKTGINDVLEGGNASIDVSGENVGGCSGGGLAGVVRAADRNRRFRLDGVHRHLSTPGPERRRAPAAASMVLVEWV